LWLFLCGGFSSVGQQILEIQLDGSEKNKPVIEVFEKLEKSYPVRFFYLPEWLDQSVFDKSYKGLSLSQALQDIFEGSEISYTVLYNFSGRKF
jgi:hypothetical protein